MLEPTWFGSYRLASRIATGGMAEVYAGRRVRDDGSLGPMVAVKRLLPHHAKTPAIVRMFLNEARITSQIHHPNVVGILELGQVGLEPFIAMELLEGKSFEELRARLAEHGRRVPSRISLFVLCEACRGLGSAHQARDESGQLLSLVHRDFTPDNVHVGFDGAVKVIDFGIARTATWGSGTEPGILKGKFFYMSPEMVLGRPVDSRADLFAAGVMLYEQLCGRRPFTGMTVEEVLKKIAVTEPAPPSTHDPAVPRALEAVVMKALRKEPAERYQSLEELVEALLASVGGDVATSDELGAYVRAQFPAEADERQKALATARAIDPSQPGRDALRADPMAFARTTPSTTLRVGAHEPSPAPTEHVPAFVRSDTLPGRPAPAPRPMSPSTAPAKAPNRSVVVFAGGLALIALAAGGIWLSAMRPKPAAEVWAEAKRQTDAASAAKTAAELVELSDATGEQLDGAAELLASAKDWDRALSFAEDWAKRSPQAMEPKLLEARAAMALRLGKRAEGAVKAAAALSATDARPDLVLAELREIQGDAPGAVEALERAHQKKPDDVRVTVRLGRLLSQAARLDDAARVLEPVVKQQKDPEALAELGFVKFRKEQYPEALRLLTSAAKARPDSMVAHYYLGAALYQKGDVEGARKAYEQADALAGLDSRPLEAWCELEKQQESPRLDGVRKRLEQRFGKEGAALAKKCAP